MVIKKPSISERRSKMVRLTSISNILSGIGITILGFSVALWYLFDYYSIASEIPFYTWAAGAILLILVILMSSVTTFTEITGFVHPEDKLVGNMFVFIQTIAAILVIGIQYPNDQNAQKLLFDVASMIVIAYVFLFVFVFFSAAILEGEETGQIKEMTSRFMLVSLVMGALMAGTKIGLDWVWATTTSYAIASAILGAFAVVLVVLIVIILGRRYEPVGE